MIPKGEIVVAIVAMLEIPIAYIESRPDGVDVYGVCRGVQINRTTNRAKV